MHGSYDCARKESHVVVNPAERQQHDNKYVTCIGFNPQFRLSQYRRNAVSWGKYSSNRQFPHPLDSFSHRRGLDAIASDLPPRAGGRVRPMPPRL